MARREQPQIRALPLQAKSLPLNGNLQQDVAEFTQESPTMVQQRNVRHVREGEVEKTQPFVARTTSGESVKGAGIRDDALFVIDGDGNVAEYDDDNDAWNVSTGNYIPHINDVIYAQEPVAGQHAAGFVDKSNITSGRDLRIIAYEVRKTAPADPVPDVDVVVEVRDQHTNRLVSKEKYSGYAEPRVKARSGNTGDVLIFMYDTATDVAAVARYNMISLSFETLVSVGLADDVDTAQLVNWVTVDTGVSQDRDAYRLGYSVNGAYGAGYAFDISDDGTGACVYLKDTNKEPALCNITTSGTKTGNETSTGFNPGDLILDIAYDSTSDECAILYWECQSFTAPLRTYGQLKGRIYDMSGVTPAVVGSEVLIYDGKTSAVDGSCAINGSVVYDGTTARYAATFSETSPNDVLPTTLDELNRVLVGKFTSGAVFAPGEWVSHRVVSNVVWDGSFGYVVVEQWMNTEPTANAGVGNILTTPPLQKGVTDVLLRFSTPSGAGTGGYKIISAFEPGQCRAVNPSSQEQTLHLNTLTLESGVFKYGARILTQPEDCYIGTGAADPTYSMNKGSFTFGEAQLKVITATPASDLNTIEYGKASIVNTSIPSWYAGDILAELSPLDQPEICYFRNSGGADPLVFTYEAPPAPADPDEIRTVQVVVGYADNNGQLHRSPPSFPVFVESAGPSDGVSADTDGSNIWRACAFTLPLSAFASQREYFVEMYIGQGSEEPQLAGTASFPVDVMNSDYAGVVAVDSLISGNVDPIRSSEVIYTAGGVLPADAWPEFNHFVVTSNRMWGVSRTVPGTLYYSKLFEENIAPEFSAALVIPFGRNRALTAVGAIDDKVIAFTEKEIFAVYGAGPDNLGGNGDFIVDKLQSPYGCIDPQSVVEIPAGLMFYSNVTNEIHLIDQDLNVMNVGKAIQDYTASADFDISTAVVYPDQYEARFFFTATPSAEFGPSRDANIKEGPARPKFVEPLPLSSGCLVYNYQYGKWTVTDDWAQFALLYRNVPALVTTAGTLRVLSNSDEAWADGNRITQETSWHRVGNMQTYGRIKTLTFLGRYLSSWKDYGGGFESSDIQVTLFYDYEGIAGDSDVYRFRANDGSLGVQSTDRMQFEVHPGRPKVQAIKVLIEELVTEKLDDDEPTYSIGRGFVLNAIDITYAQKAGTGIKTKNQAAEK